MPPNLGTDDKNVKCKRYYWITLKVLFMFEVYVIVTVIWVKGYLKIKHVRNHV